MIDLQAGLCTSSLSEISPRLTSLFGSVSHTVFHCPAYYIWFLSVYSMQGKWFRLCQQLAQSGLVSFSFLYELLTCFCFGFGFFLFLFLLLSSLLASCLFLHWVRPSWRVESINLHPILARFNSVLICLDFCGARRLLLRVDFV